jgi:hypothetical protein
VHIDSCAGSGKEERLAIIVVAADAAILHQLGPVAVIDDDADGRLRVFPARSAWNAPRKAV